MRSASQPLRHAAFLSALLVAGSSGAPRAQVSVVASTPTIADLVRQVGGEHVAVDSIMRGPENPHNVIAKPSYMMKLRRADLLVHTGLDAEPWILPLIQGARKSHLLQGNEGHVNISVGIPLKQVPTRGQLTRAQGDIHVYGNPHYLLDPKNAARAARTIQQALARTNPDHAVDYERNYETFAKRLADLEKRMQDLMKPYRGLGVVTYHRAWIYLLDVLGLRKIGEVEPKPGIQPFPAHLEQCIANMRAQGAKVVIVETFNVKENADHIAEAVGGTAVVLPLEVRGVPEVTTYEELIDYQARRLASTFDALGLKTAEGRGSEDRDK